MKEEIKGESSMKYKTVKEMLNNGLNKDELNYLYVVNKVFLNIDKKEDLYDKEIIDNLLKILENSLKEYAYKLNINNFIDQDEKEYLKSCEFYYDKLNDLTYECEEWRND